MRASGARKHTGAHASSHQKRLCPAGGGGGGLSAFEHGARAKMSPPSYGVAHPGSHTHSSLAPRRTSLPCGPHSLPVAGATEGGGAREAAPSQFREMKLKVGCTVRGAQAGVSNARRPECSRAGSEGDAHRCEARERVRMTAIPLSARADVSSAGLSQCICPVS